MTAVMTVPDYADIADVMLASEGFCNSVSYSKKFKNLMNLLQDNLPKMFHFDFGMR